MTNNVLLNFRFLVRHPAHFFALGFGAGLAPKAPGTFGTLAALPVYFLMSVFLNNIAYLVITAVFLLFGIWVCGVTGRALGVDDHGAVVWDEIVGYLVTMFLAPLSIWSVVIGFIFFRIFDILKPFPISWFDKHIKGGLGTMLDDVLAGIYAWFCLQAALFFLSDLLH